MLAKTGFKNVLGKIKYLRILSYLECQYSRIPGFDILFKNSNSGYNSTYCKEQNTAWLLAGCKNVSLHADS